MITVLGRATSSNVQAVMWCAAELRLKVDRRDVGGAFGGADTPEYLAMNPTGMIPTALIEGEAIHESPAIIRCLSALHGDEVFWPADPLRRARLDVWAEWAKNTLEAAFLLPVFVPLVRQAPEARDLAAIDRGVAATLAQARILDARLSDHAFVGGELFTFADIVPGHLLYRLHELIPEMDARLRAHGERWPDLPHLARYYAALQARPAYAEHVMISFESLRNTA